LKRETIRSACRKSWQNQTKHDEKKHGCPKQIAKLEAESKVGERGEKRVSPFFAKFVHQGQPRTYEKSRLKKASGKKVRGGGKVERVPRLRACQ